MIPHTLPILPAAIMDAAIPAFNAALTDRFDLPEKRDWLRAAVHASFIEEADLSDALADTYPIVALTNVMLQRCNQVADEIEADITDTYPEDHLGGLFEQNMTLDPSNIPVVEQDASYPYPVNECSDYGISLTLFEATHVDLCEIHHLPKPLARAFWCAIALIESSLTPMVNSYDMDHLAEWAIDGVEDSLFDYEGNGIIQPDGSFDLERLRQTSNETPNGRCMMEELHRDDPTRLSDVQLMDDIHYALKLRDEFNATSPDYLKGFKQKQTVKQKLRSLTRQARRLQRDTRLSAYSAWLDFILAVCKKIAEHPQPVDDTAFLIDPDDESETSIFELTLIKLRPNLDAIIAENLSMMRMETGYSATFLIPFSCKPEAIISRYTHGHCLLSWAEMLCLQHQKKREAVEQAETPKPCVSENCEKLAA